MTESKTLEEAERKSRRAMWTMKALTFVTWLTFIVFLVVTIKKGMQPKNIINDIQVEQLAVVALQFVEPRDRDDNAALEEAFQTALPKALRLMELTHDFLDAKKRAKKTDPDK